MSSGDESEEPVTKTRRRPKMTKKARVLARRRMKPGMDPAQNNPNDVGAKIIPVGTPSSL
jgi:hypothetical protein